MDIIYAQATKEDIERICALSDDLITRYEDFTRVNKEKAIGWTHITISENISRFSVIIVNGRKVGYLFISLKDGMYEIHNFYIEPEYRNRGIGSEVIRQCIKDTDGNIQVYVFTGDVGTYSFFENLGFMNNQVYQRTRYLMVYDKKDIVMDEVEALFETGEVK